MNSCKSFLPLFFLTVLTGCGQRPSPLSLSPGDENPLTFLSVSCDVSDEPGDAKAIILRIKNRSDRRLEDVSITFNNSYTARLKDLRIYLSPLKGTAPLGRSSVLPGDDLEFVFSHDISNHQNMTNQSGKTLSFTIVPASISIRTENSVGTWTVK